jgi:ubiquinol oxidase
MQHGRIQVRISISAGTTATNIILVYTEEQLNQVIIAHREAKTWSDKAALIAVKVMRWSLDKATGYKHEKGQDVDAKTPLAARKKFAMNEEKYLIRNVFLESVAGVPGMVAGMLRHLHSMRRMKRDNGWYAPPPPLL